MKVVVEHVVRNDPHTDFRASALDQRQHFAVLFVSLGNDALSRASIAHVIHESTRSHSTLSCHGPKRHGNPLAAFSHCQAASTWGQTPRALGAGGRGV